jgi:hypothetical protein
VCSLSKHFRRRLNWIGEPYQWLHPRLVADYGERLDEQARSIRARPGSFATGQLIDDLLNLSCITRREMRHEATRPGLLPPPRGALPLGPGAHQASPPGSASPAYGAGVIACDSRSAGQVPTCRRRRRRKSEAWMRRVGGSPRWERQIKHLGARVQCRSSTMRGVDEKWNIERANQL